MNKTMIVLALLLSMPSVPSAAVDTLIRHDTVFVNSLIVDNPDAAKSMASALKTISPVKKTCGWTMVLAGVASGAFSIVNFTEGGKVLWARDQYRKAGFYEINICFSVGLVAAGVSMIVK